MYDATAGRWVNGGHKYSTDEHVVGTWIDGKPLYEKTVNTTIALNTSDERVTLSVATNVDRITSLKAIQRLQDGTYMESPVIASDGNYSRVRASVYETTVNLFHKCTISSWITNLADIFTTIQYTKTTD
jgi:hypothetical protein